MAEFISAVRPLLTLADKLSVRLFGNPAKSDAVGGIVTPGGNVKPGGRVKPGGIVIPGKFFLGGRRKAIYNPYGGK